MPFVLGGGGGGGAFGGFGSLECLERVEEGKLFEVSIFNVFGGDCPSEASTSLKNSMKSIRSSASGIDTSLLLSCC